MDLEMTGLDPDRDRIIEIATIITDASLTIIEEGPVLAIKQPESVLNLMDEWNQRVHTSTGLVARVQDSKTDTAGAEQATLEFIERHLFEGRAPLCGNSICQDRRFLARCMPELEAYFHYRNLDVSSLKELARRWAPKVEKSFKKRSSHLAMDDIKDSIRELEHYREHFIKLPEAE